MNMTNIVQYSYIIFVSNILGMQLIAFFEHHFCTHIHIPLILYAAKGTCIEDHVMSCKAKIIIKHRLYTAAM